MASNETEEFSPTNMQLRIDQPPCRRELVKGQSVRISLEASNPIREETAAVHIEVDQPEVLVDRILEVLAARFPIDAFYRVLSQRQGLIREAVNQLSPNTRGRLNDMTPNTLTHTFGQTLYGELIRLAPSPTGSHVDSPARVARAESILCPPENESKLKDLIGDYLKTASRESLEELSNRLSVADSHKLARILLARNDFAATFADEGKWEEMAQEELIAEKETEHSSAASSESSESAEEEEESSSSFEAILPELSPTLIAHLLTLTEPLGFQETLSLAKVHNTTNQRIWTVVNSLSTRPYARAYCLDYLNQHQIIPPSTPPDGGNVQQPTEVPLHTSIPHSTIDHHTTEEQRTATLPPQLMQAVPAVSDTVPSDQQFSSMPPLPTQQEQADHYNLEQIDGSTSNGNHTTSTLVDTPHPVIRPLREVESTPTTQQEQGISSNVATMVAGANITNITTTTRESHTTTTTTLNAEVEPSNVQGVRRVVSSTTTKTLHPIPQSNLDNIPLHVPLPEGVPSERRVISRRIISTSSYQPSGHTVDPTYLKIRANDPSLTHHNNPQVPLSPWETEIEHELAKEAIFMERSCKQTLQTMFTNFGVRDSNKEVPSTLIDFQTVVDKHGVTLRAVASNVKHTVYMTMSSLLTSLGFESNIELTHACEVPPHDEDLNPVLSVVKEAAVRLSIIALAETLTVSTDFSRVPEELTAIIETPRENFLRQRSSGLMQYLDARRATILRDALNAAVDAIHWVKLVHQEVVEFVDALFQNSNTQHVTDAVSAQGARDLAQTTRIISESMAGKTNRYTEGTTRVPMVGQATTSYSPMGAPLVSTNTTSQQIMYSTPYQKNLGSPTQFQQMTYSSSPIQHAAMSTMSNSTVLTPDSPYRGGRQAAIQSQAAVRSIPQTNRAVVESTRILTNNNTVLHATANGLASSAQGPASTPQPSTIRSSGYNATTTSQSYQQYLGDSANIVRSPAVASVKPLSSTDMLQNQTAYPSFIASGFGIPSAQTPAASSLLESYRAASIGTVPMSTSLQPMIKPTSKQMPSSKSGAPTSEVQPSPLAMLRNDKPNPLLEQLAEYYTTA